MTSQESFIAAIQATPEDDTTRLAYADWLEEYGDAKDQKWATMIRHQVALARVPHNHRPGKQGRCPRCVMDKENKPLVGWANWNLVPITLDGRCAFSRGFVDRVACTSNDWLTAWPPNPQSLGLQHRPFIRPTLVIEVMAGCHLPTLGASLAFCSNAHVIGVNPEQQQYLCDYAPGGRFGPRNTIATGVYFYEPWAVWAAQGVIGRDWQGRQIWPTSICPETWNHSIAQAIIYQALSTPSPGG